MRIIEQFAIIGQLGMFYHGLQIQMFDEESII
jgi:hypothetical protein